MVGSLALPMPDVAATVPGTGYEVFPADNVWRLNVRNLPVHRKSAMWKRATHAGSRVDRIVTR